MRKWATVPFVSAVADKTSGNPKIPQSEYLSTGQYPIIDQGKDFISGFTNDPQLVHRADEPVIVFGDHTRCFKYVDFRFCIGADGVRVLQPQGGWDPKFLYYYLSSLPIPSAGYSRHFRFLKQHEVIRPPLEDQRWIAEVLNRADALRVKRREALAHLDDLAESIFVAMFGDPTLNTRGWPTICLADTLAAPLRNGVSPSTDGQFEAYVLTLSSITGDRFRPAARKPGAFAKAPLASQTVSIADFLICRGNGNPSLVGRGFFPTKSMPDTAFPDIIIAARIQQDRTRPAFLEAVWRSTLVRAQIESKARTTNGTYKVNQTILEGISFYSPDLELQDEFARRISSIDELRARNWASLAELDALFGSLQDRAFRGLL